LHRVCKLEKKGQEFGNHTRRAERIRPRCRER
jgi:hypothetical protein